ncbi:MAG: AAA family ATPase [Bacteroidetes bacterium]|nr:AAA family ATPase [Bacteroidota bacterium]
MYLSLLKLWNFRKYGAAGNIDLDSPHVELPLKNGLNLLVGENDSGKTAIVDAIKIVLQTHSNEWIRIEHEDFFDNSTSFRIECHFEGLSDEEAKNFVEWLSWKGTGADAKPLLIVSMTVNRTADRILPTELRAGPKEENYPLSAEARAYLRATYLRPLRDAKAELIPKRNSRLSQILLSHSAFQPTGGGEHSFVVAVNELNKGILGYFTGKDKDGNELPPENRQGISIKDTIDSYLEKFASKKSKFEMNGTNLRSVLESLCLLFENELNLGLGSHNLLCIASELLHLQKSDWTGLRLALIEEIEAHLHPQVQMQVVDTLQKVAISDGIQLILTTHSPNIASKIPLENLILCQDKKTFPMGKAFTKLRETDYKFLERFLDVTKANMFFAKGVIVVEGWAEEQLIPAFAQKIGISLTEKGISIVNVGSTAFLRYSRIFLRPVGSTISIPVSVINDVDIKPYESGIMKTIEEEGAQREIRKTAAEIHAEVAAAITVKTAKFTDQNVRGFISHFWTLEYCIAKSVKLRKLFYKSVLMALKEEKEDAGVANLAPYDEAIRQIDTYFNNWEDSADEIAYMIMNHIITGENNIGIAKQAISKAIIAQIFASNLVADATITDLNTEPSIAYLLNAITYAATRI